MLNGTGDEHHFFHPICISLMPQVNQLLLINFYKNSIRPRQNRGLPYIQRAIKLGQAKGVKWHPKVASIMRPICVKFDDTGKKIFVIHLL